MKHHREIGARHSDRTRSLRRSVGLVTRLSDDMHARWARGERVRVEDYISSHPELLDDPDSALGLIYEELCLCEGLGEPLALADLVRRFPQWEQRLPLLLDRRGLLTAAQGHPRFPECGEVLGAFRLVAELGHGLHGKVFLATEPKLANRALVLKVTAASGREHLSLARLQHTHIVPLYFAEDDAGTGLRVLGMPFFGGASLERFLGRLDQRPLAARSGKDFVDWLNDERRAIPAELGLATDGLERLASLSYASVVCWIGVCIAEAIQHAHEKGLVHLDLKPSNVLIAADGAPMLLDFHLARDPIRARSAAPLWLGGTPRYMSPEQAAAFDALSFGKAIPQDVDERSDIYSLGLLLYELLGGSSPPDASVGDRLQAIGRVTSVGLADMIAKCLAREPARRYCTAASLAADLNRHLKNEPLQTVSNRSLRERWRKWRRRAPLALRNWGLAMGLIGAVGIAAVLLWNREVESRAQTQALLIEGRQRLVDGQFELAQRALQQGLHVAAVTHGAGTLAREIERDLDRARIMKFIGEFHALIDELRNLYGFEPLPRREVLKVLPHCQAVWSQRFELVQRSRTTLLPADRELLVNDLLELAILWSDLRLRTQAGADRNASRTEVLGVLDEAESLAGPSAVIAYERLEGRERDRFDVDGALAGLRSTDSRRGAWEAYALGLALLNDGRLPAAGRCLGYAADLRPESAWTQFYYGRCQFQLKNHTEAARAFFACIALAPRHAGAYYNRAVVFESLGEPERALRDYDRALALEPRLAHAALNRGILQYHRHTPAAYAAARKDLQRALAQGADPVSAHYNLALVEAALGNNQEAAANVGWVLDRAPGHAGALELSKIIPPRPGAAHGN